MAGLLRQAIAAGEIPEQNVELSAAALVGAIAESLVGPLSPVAGEIAARGRHRRHAGALLPPQRRRAGQAALRRVGAGALPGSRR